MRSAALLARSAFVKALNDFCSSSVTRMSAAFPTRDDSLKNSIQPISLSLESRTRIISVQQAAVWAIRMLELVRCDCSRQWQSCSRCRRCIPPHSAINFSIFKSNPLQNMQRQLTESFLSARLSRTSSFENGLSRSSSIFRAYSGF